MTFLEFTFSSGWHFFGMVLLLSMGIGIIAATASGIAEIIRAFWGKE